MLLLFKPIEIELKTVVRSDDFKEALAENGMLFFGDSFSTPLIPGTVVYFKSNEDTDEDFTIYRFRIEIDGALKALSYVMIFLVSISLLYFTISSIISWCFDSMIYGSIIFLALIYIGTRIIFGMTSESMKKKIYQIHSSRWKVANENN